jgi:hypothetical protein
MLLSKCYVHDINKVPKVCDYNDILPILHNL